MPVLTCLPVVPNVFPDAQDVDDVKTGRQTAVYPNFVKRNAENGPIFFPQRYPTSITASAQSLRGSWQSVDSSEEGSTETRLVEGSFDKYWSIGQEAAEKERNESLTLDGPNAAVPSGHNRGTSIASSTSQPDSSNQSIGSTTPTEIDGGTLDPQAQEEWERKRLEVDALGERALIKNPEPPAVDYVHVPPSKDDLKLATSENWRRIRAQTQYKDAMFSNGVWTIDTTDMFPRAISEIPARIAGRPVILNYLPAVHEPFPDYPDPMAGKQIDPREDINDETLRLLFKTYPGTRAACVYLNKTMVVLHGRKFDRRTELRERPRVFGGLKVDHALFNQIYTSSPLEAEIGSEKFCAEYYPGGNRDQEPEGGHHKVGLRLRHKDTRQEYLTTATHFLVELGERAFIKTEAIAGERVNPEFNPWYNAEKFLNENKDSYSFYYDDEEFGKLVCHFDPNILSSFRGSFKRLKSDISLIGLPDETSPKMPIPVFRHSDPTKGGTPCKIEWGDINDPDLINQELFLLGYKIEQQRPDEAVATGTGTSFEAGAVVSTPKDYENKTVKMGQTSMELGTESSTEIDRTQEERYGSSQATSQMPTTYKSLVAQVEGKVYELVIDLTKFGPEEEIESFRPRFENGVHTLSVFKRAVLWRPDFGRDPDNGKLQYKRDRARIPFPSIRGASGCPLAVKIEKKGETIYKVIAFQSSQNITSAQEDDPEEFEDKEALLRRAWHGTFRTYQATIPPKDLIDKYDIVWGPGPGGSDTMIPSQKDRNPQTKRTRRPIGKIAKLSNTRVKTRPLFNLYQRRYNRYRLIREQEWYRADGPIQGSELASNSGVEASMSRFDLSNAEKALSICCNLITSTDITSPQFHGTQTLDIAEKMLKDALAKLDALRVP
ncbi:hypothetical protein TWF481_007565 [Arthrobotrys musiformis]|uniref:Uncharacterized protein n=1 Tax=Arthrobotrys musiformis TaxID=47236 RepID=A0AAV9WC06_9PEZI